MLKNHAGSTDMDAVETAASFLGQSYWYDCFISYKNPKINNWTQSFIGPKY